MDRIILLLLLLPATLIALVIHELAHGKMAFYRGDPTALYENRLTLNPMVHFEPVGTLLLAGTMAFSVLTGMNPMICFGWAKPVPVKEEYLVSPLDIILVAAAGPAVNIVFAIAAGLPFQLGLLALPVGAFTSAGLISAFLYLFVNVNILLAIFNLMPIPPLDGSKIICQFLPEDWQHHIKYPSRMILIMSVFITLFIINWSVFKCIIMFFLTLCTNISAIIG